VQLRRALLTLLLAEFTLAPLEGEHLFLRLLQELLVFRHRWLSVLHRVGSVLVTNTGR
jgi:hypothetical protein